ncbi:hypothetical protein Trydic_g2185 [Trypoxylus dichotomus]
MTRVSLKENSDYRFCGAEAESLEYLIPNCTAVIGLCQPPRQRRRRRGGNTFCEIITAIALKLLDWMGSYKYRQAVAAYSSYKEA